MQQHFAPRKRAGKSILDRPTSDRVAHLAYGTAAAIAFLLAAPYSTAQGEDKGVIEEVVVTGTHIRGATISGVLPVSVMDAQDIELFGVDSGDDLLEALPEQGQNFFNEAENISGGVNSARGDVGAFNLRNLGTGNTLVLLNGRRLVNAASFQTEEVGGSFVPVNTVNSNTIPVYGLERLEVLKRRRYPYSLRLAVEFPSG